MIKNYMLDTNILLQNPGAIFGFADNNVFICGTTLQELDGKKTAGGEIGYAARECCRIIDSLREQGDLTEGVDLENGGKFFVEPDGVSEERLPKGFSISVPDNRIISSCIYLRDVRKFPIILVTNDISMRINASICGVKVEGYLNDHISSEEGEYTGHTTIDCDSKYIDYLYQQKKAGKDGSFAKLPKKVREMADNEFATLRCGNQSVLTMKHSDGLEVLTSVGPVFGGVKPMNAMQIFALKALLAPADEIPLVILLGPAGTAKTFLSLAAGLTNTYLGQGDYSEERYRKILISRPNVETAEKGFGYLPGDLQSKTENLLANYYDNLEALLSQQHEDPAQVSMQIDDMLETGVIEICPLNYIRGRSLKNCYIVCDEAQNASRSLIRDVITRAGVGTKVVLAGDINQVDSPNLDKRNNGLVYAMEHMKESPLCAVIRFSEENCVRSELAEAAIKLMKW